MRAIGCVMTETVQPEADETRRWTFAEAVRICKRQILFDALTAHHGNRTHAARALGLRRTYLVRLIRQYRIDVPPRTPR